MLLCPWDSLGGDSGVGSPALLQGIFRTQGSNPRLPIPLPWQTASLWLSHLGHMNAYSVLHPFGLLLVKVPFPLKDAKTGDSPHQGGASQTPEF